MKKEFPILYDKVSNLVVIPLGYFWALIYVQRAITQPANQVYTVGMAAFGITAALSGVCFAMATAPYAELSTELSTGTYAGEKFLLSSILLIQTLLVVSLQTALLDLQIVKDHVVAKHIVSGISAALLSFITTAAVWTWHHGITSLSEYLWKNWERRICHHNKREQESQKTELATSKTNKTE